MFRLVSDKHALKKAANLLADKISAGEIKTKNQLENEKIRIAKKYSFGKIPKNAELLPLMEKKEDLSEVKKLLSMKPVRTASGVANIAVMWSSDIDIGNEKTFSCPADCIYCPQGKNSPKSYMGVEPTTLRAIRNNYDPYKQLENRLHHFHITGHPTDKCELILMGGTFTAMNNPFRRNFIKRCYDALNEKNSSTLEEAIRLNETAPNRCVGLTIETRSDFCDEKIISEILGYGTTRVEIGVQSTSNSILKKVNRGHDTRCNKDAFSRLRKAGLKITAHWMPGLTGLFELDLNKEISLFSRLFSDPSYRPDELKIYPTLVIPGTKLHEMWKAGKYKGLSEEEMAYLLVELKKRVPGYVRIKRVMRDISEHEVSTGPSKTNLRQMVKESGAECNCIRCREVGLSRKEPENIELCSEEYEASGGREFFISYEDPGERLLVGFIRLRLDSKATVRELHVYGNMASLHEKGGWQHHGYGAGLLKKAEEIAKENGYASIRITSGVGVRNYYRRLGYRLENCYMTKAI